MLLLFSFYTAIHELYLRSIGNIPPNNSLEGLNSNFCLFQSGFYKSLLKSLIAYILSCPQDNNNINIEAVGNDNRSLPY